MDCEIEFALLNLKHASPSPYCPAEHKASDVLTEILHGIGNEIWNFFKEGLKVVGLYHPITNYFYPELYQNDVTQMNTEFAKSLSSIRNANANTETSNAEFNPAAEVHNTELDKKKLLLTLGKIKQDVRQTSGTKQITAHLTAVVGILNASVTEEPTTEEWSEASLLLDHVSDLWEKTLPIVASREQQLLTKLIDYTKRDCRLKAGVPAYQIVTNEFAKKHANEWKLGRSNTESYNGSLGVATPFSAIGWSASGSVAGAYDEIRATDPEGYYTEYKYGRFGVSGELKAKFSIGVAKLEVSLVGTAQGVYGGFNEWKTSMAYATRNLKALISAHGNNSKVKPYFSRASLVANSWGTTIAPAADRNLLNSLDEVSEIPRLLREFDLIKDEAEQLLSLYLSPITAEKIETYHSAVRDDKDVLVENYSDRPLVTSSPIKLPEGELVEAEVTGFVGKLVVGTEGSVGASLGPESLNTEGSEDASLGPKSLKIFAFSVHGTGEWRELTRKEIKKSSIGETFMNPTKSKYKASIKQQAAARFDVFKDKLKTTLNKEADAYQSSFTELGMEVLSRARNLLPPLRENFYNEKLSAEVNEELYSQALKNYQKNRVTAAELLKFLVDNNLDAGLMKLGQMNDAVRQQVILRTPRLVSKRQVTDCDFSNEANFKTYFNYLKQDFNDYIKIRNGLLGGKYDNLKQKQKVEAMLRTFQACYGAKTHKQLIQRMVFATGYLITHSTDEQLMEDMLEFEQVVLPYGDDDCYFIEDANINITDITLEAKVKVALPCITAAIKPVFKAKVAYNAMGHTNELRTAESLSISITLAGEIHIASAMGSLVPEIYKHIPGQFSEFALAQVESGLHIIEPTGSFGLERTYTWNFSKPDVYSDNSLLSLRQFSYRKTQSAITKSGGKLEIPLGPCDLVVGAEYIHNNTVPLEEECGDNTVFQLAIIYEHGVHIGTINKMTGEIEEGCEYDLYMKEQDKSFEQLCINYGMELNHQKASSISRELNAIEAAIDKNTNFVKQLLLTYQQAYRAAKAASDQEAVRELLIDISLIKTKQFSHELTGELEKYNFTRAKQKFADAAQQFKLNSTSENKTTAWNCFNKLMLAYYPQWIERKTGSACYTPRPLPEVKDANLLAKERIQQAKLSAAAMTMPYGSLAYAQ